MTEFNREETIRKNTESVNKMTERVAMSMSIAFGMTEPNRFNVELGAAVARYVLDASAFAMMQAATLDPSMVQPGQSVTHEDVIRHARKTMIDDVERLRRACDGLLQFYKSF